MIQKLVIAWLKLVAPRYYREAIIGDLLESVYAESSRDSYATALRLLWQVVISTPSILIMRVRESHEQLNRQIVETILAIGLSLLLLERFVFAVAAWHVAEAWSIQSIVVIRLIYLGMSVISVAVLFALLRLRSTYKVSLYTIIAEPILSLYTIMLCFSYAGVNLLAYFSFDLLAFRVLQLCSVYFCMRLIIKSDSKTYSTS